RAEQPEELAGHLAGITGVHNTSAGETAWSGHAGTRKGLLAYGELDLRVSVQRLPGPRALRDHLAALAPRALLPLDLANPAERLRDLGLGRRQLLADDLRHLALRERRGDRLVRVEQH